MLDNLDAAVMSKLNELTERHGLKPYDFSATIDWKTDDRTNVSNYHLTFETPVHGNSLREDRFDRLLTDIGVLDDQQLIGTPEKIVEALDHALSIAPKPRTRF